MLNFQSLLLPFNLSLHSTSTISFLFNRCTTSISFVTDTLFPYAAERLQSHVAAAWGSQELADDIAALALQSTDDVQAGLVGAADALVGSDAVAAAHAATLISSSETDGTAKTTTIAAVTANVLWQMAANRKTGALKQLQGHIWRSGYATGALKGHVFDDVLPALQAWVAAGRRVYIYSSGSREAQRLLFNYSSAGDLRPLISGFFDTKVGPKTSSMSYSDIVLSLGVDFPCRVLFLTDALLEAQAARSAGLCVAVTDRPGNAMLPSNHGFRVIATFAEALKTVDK